MKINAILFALATVLTVLTSACGQIVDDGGNGLPGRPLPPPAGGDDCVSDQCVCPPGEACSHACEPGNAECHVSGATGQATQVTCDENLECHVECATSASCRVECGGSAECHVTCPASGCTVTGCVGPECVVSCGAFGAATRSGTTAMCP
jgi:hypothetical protein